mgnify:CR=1 FL=1
MPKLSLTEHGQMPGFGRLGRGGSMGRMAARMGGWADGRTDVRIGWWEDGWVGGMHVRNDAGCVVVCRSC